MDFAHDPTMNFYYLGEEPARSGLYTEHLKNPPTIAVDTETVSLTDKRVIGIGVATSSHSAFYFPLIPEASSCTPWHLLVNPAIVQIYQNGLFDLFALAKSGAEVAWNNIRDTNVMARLLCHRDASLVGLSWIHRMEVHNAGDFIKEHGAKDMLHCPPDDVAKKCMQDALATYALYERFIPEIDLSYFLTEMALYPILMRMSLRGIKLDQEYREHIEEILADDVNYLYKMCQDMEGFNPGSPQQCSYILAKRGAYRVFSRLPYTDRSKRHLSSGSEVLEQMDDTLAGLILLYRQKAALLSGYLIPWDKESDGRAHTRFHLDAATGRPSSTERNLQNIPKGEIRGCLIPDHTIFTDMDYSQLELRILAHLSKDPTMQYIFSLPTFNSDGSKNREADIHGQTADFLGIKRDLAKNVNFAYIYGGTDQTLMETAKIRSIEQARHLMGLWADKYPVAGAWIADIQGRTYNDPYAYTLYGRKIRLDIESPDINSMMKKNINYRMQGSAAEIFKRSLLKCQHLDIALQVHDEMLFDGYVEEQWLRQELEHISPLHTPIDVRYRGRWE